MKLDIPPDENGRPRAAMSSNLCGYGIEGLSVSGLKNRQSQNRKSTHMDNSKRKEEKEIRL